MINFHEWLLETNQDLSDKVLSEGCSCSCESCEDGNCSKCSCEDCSCDGCSC